MRASEKLLALALGEEGYLEKKSPYLLDDKTANAGSGNFTKYARDLDKTDIFNGPKQGFDWCAVFAVWTFWKSFGLETARKILYLPVRSCGAGVDWLVRYFRAAGAFGKEPAPGDFVFFTNATGSLWQHVGLVERVEAGRVYTVEGNTSGASGVIWNGGGVARKSYPVNYERIGGYGRPDWALVQDEEDEEMTNAQKEALFEEFKARLTGKDIADVLEPYLASKPAPDWAEGELSEAKDLGITDGTQPMRYVTRFEAAIMAKRAARAK